MRYLRGMSATPRKLTDETVGIVCAMLRNGNSEEASAKAADISPNTHFRWLARGRSALATLEADGTVHDDDFVYLDYARETAKSRAQAEIEAITGILEAGRGPIRERHVKYGPQDEQGRRRIVEVKEFEKAGDWHALAWWAERLIKETWAAQRVIDPRDVNAGGDATPLEEKLKVTPETAAKIAKLVHAETKVAPNGHVNN